MCFFTYATRSFDRELEAVCLRCDRSPNEQECQQQWQKLKRRWFRQGGEQSAFLHSQMESRRNAFPTSGLWSVVRDDRPIGTGLSWMNIFIAIKALRSTLQLKNQRSLQSGRFHFTHSCWCCGHCCSLNFFLVIFTFAVQKKWEAKLYLTLTPRRSTAPRALAAAVCAVSSLMFVCGSFADAWHWSMFAFHHSQPGCHHPKVPLEHLQTVLQRESPRHWLRQGKYKLWLIFCLTRTAESNITFLVSLSL